MMTIAAAIPIIIPKNIEFNKVERTVGKITPSMIIKKMIVNQSGISFFAISLTSPKKEI